MVGDRGCDPRNDWLCALLRPVRSWSPAPARNWRWPHPGARPPGVSGAGCVSSQSCRVLRPGPEPRPVRRRRERMNSLTDLREVVDVVIGVDTHVHTHSAAVVDAATGGVLDEITVEATAEGYSELVEFANNHAMLRAWRSRGPVVTAPGRVVTCWRCRRSSSSWDRPSGLRVATARSPICSMRSALRVKRWLDRGWELPVPANAKPCRCFWLLAAPRSMPPPRPSSKSSAWSSPHPNPSESGSAARSLPRCSTPPRTCESTPPGTPKRPAPWWRCGPWLVARTRC